MGALGRCVFALAAAVALADAHAGVGDAAVANQAQQNQVRTNQNAANAAVRNLPSSRKNADRCKNPDADNGPDICAQWAAANAAREANKINSTALMWTVAGFFAILLTLFATAWAAFAAGSAARAANRSLDLFQRAEGGQLVPRGRLDSYDVMTIGLQNVGRSSVKIIHADLCCVEELPDKPLPDFMTKGAFAADVVIRPDTTYTFGNGPMGIPRNNPEVWILGGAIYETVFGGIEVAPVALHLDRTTGQFTPEWNVSFSQWESMAERLRKIRRKAKKKAG
jgi:hypothetical protein